MTLGNEMELLSEIPLFEGFSSEQLRLIAFSAESVRLPGKTTLFHQGTAAESAYVVVSGGVTLSGDGEDGPVDFGFAGQGALIGEMALLARGTRPATAVTVEDSEFMMVSRRLFQKVLDEYPEMAAHLRHVVGQRLQALMRDLNRIEPILSETD